jgi:MFS superfamily sulfate permease-like transporter
MSLHVISGLIIAATVLHGFIAGIGVDRVLVQMPAWRKVGSRAWAAYSRHADLGNGLFLYPFEAIAGALLTLVAALMYFLNQSLPRSAALPIYLAALFAVGGLLATARAAPKMMSLRQIGHNPSAIQEAFEGFDRWGAVRAVLQALAFGANLWSLVTLLGGIH